MRLLGVASAVLALIAGSACENCSCGAYRSYATVMLTESDYGKTVPVGLFESFGVLLPGSGRSVNVSDPTRLNIFPTPYEPNGMTLVTYEPNATQFNDKQFVFGGLITFSSPGALFQSEWHASVVIGTDPSSERDPATYVGGGTTVMAEGQSFVLAWPVGGVGPTSSNDSVLAPQGLPALAQTAYQQTGQTAITYGQRFMQQLFLAMRPGAATISSPDALAASSFVRMSSIPGSTQRFLVVASPDFTCSLKGGCVQAKVGGPFRPDHYYGPTETPPSP